jgi:hypothetical protein
LLMSASTSSGAPGPFTGKVILHRDSADASAESSLPVYARKHEVQIPQTSN